MLLNTRDWCYICQVDKTQAMLHWNARTRQNYCTACLPWARPLGKDKHKAYWEHRDPWQESLDGSKLCQHCQQWLHVEQFSRDNRRFDGLNRQCNRCIKRIRDIRKYGRTVEPDDTCEICGSVQMRTIDHDHATGATRGILCTTCNLGIATFYDDVTLLRRAVAYLICYQPWEIDNAIPQDERELSRRTALHKITARDQSRKARRIFRSQ